jgi:hypothetical protein
MITMVVAALAFFYSINSSADTVENIDTKSSANKNLSPPSYVAILDEQPATPLIYDAQKSASLSALVPGVGQWYCDHKYRAAAFLVSEISFGLFSQNRRNMYATILNDQVKHSRLKAASYYDSMRMFVHNQTLYQNYYEKCMAETMSSDLWMYQQKAARYSLYHGIEWMAGIYLWNIADAIDCSNAFHDSRPRKPSTAVLLSFSPYLGLGQIYNQSFFKAGLVWTSQTVLSIMAYDQHSLWNDCIEKRNQVNATKLLQNQTKQLRISEWNQELNTAFKMRNTYLWLLVFSYFYGICDALVDAHLHDYPINMQLQPQTQENTLKLNFSINTSF